MAGPNNRNEKRSRMNGSGAAVDEESSEMADVPANEGRHEPSFEGRKYGEETPPAAVAPRRGFFDIYKPSQGYFTRIWSGVAAGVLVCWSAFFLYEKLELLGTGRTVRYIQVGIPVGLIIAVGLFVYWVLALNRRVCDFMIATEGEMKKVNWTSRKEIIGSTKVVVFVLVFMALLLFFVDVFFMLGFTAIGILKGGSVIDIIKGLSK